ncbi:hypothetical protein AYO20_04089 [Fonsecaea nubica]|uniref:Ribosomal protein eL8/eL30/eS12/Gadd45 domain-containing protein n=1 Tax=Fonsecaea nubica TaxID=856822 RepID=A0A178D527_9EURO|nr:hypothetical protein AYO20_04089 [Fonsecaea nubica]OAL36757.1 hypothetical protein AYO20_04089 [Fonsecaea nubica]
MAKDKSGASKKDSKAERKAERKAEKEARKAEKVAKKQAAATTKASGAGPTGVTKPKGENKEKKAARKVLAEKALNELEGKSNKKKAEVKDEEDDDESGEEEDDEMEEQNGVKVEGQESDGESEDEDEKPKKAKADSEKKNILAARPVGALVPFANPLADEKVAKKVFKCVKKAASQRTLRRGVKEVVKALRKSPTTSTDKLPLGVVVLAADISPMDVISHIPVLAEDHNVPYIYVTSRAELGTAGQTKRPTSVVMVSRDAGKKAAKDGKEKKIEEEGDEKESWEDTYKSLVKVVEREGRHVKI